MCFIGVLLIALGGAMLFFGDFFWALQDFSNRAEGRVSERTDEYDAMQKIGGVVLAVIGVLVVIFNFSSATGRAATPTATVALRPPVRTALVSNAPDVRATRTAAASATALAAVSPVAATPVASGVASPAASPVSGAATPAVAPVAATPATAGGTPSGAAVAVTVQAVADPGGPATAAEAGPGRHFVACEVTVQNTGTAALGVVPYYFGVVTAGGQRVGAFPGEVHSLPVVALPPGASVRGVVYFAVPDGDPPATLVYQSPGGAALTLPLR